jgi:hypothetical protein
MGEAIAELAAKWFRQYEKQPYLRKRQKSSHNERMEKVRYSSGYSKEQLLKLNENLEKKKKESYCELRKKTVYFLKEEPT